MTTDPLARVKRAAQAERRAREELRASLVAAHDAGASYAELARLAGVSRQAVRERLTR